MHMHMHECNVWRYLIFKIGNILHKSVNTQDGYSTLMLAALKGETEVVVELVKAGANVDVQTKVYQ